LPIKNRVIPIRK